MISSIESKITILNLREKIPDILVFITIVSQFVFQTRVKSVYDEYLIIFSMLNS